MSKLHFKARREVYTEDKVNRFPVPDEKVPWSVQWDEYKPTKWCRPQYHSAKPPVWADPVDTSLLHFNQVDNKVDRNSYEGKYDVVNGLPLNPRGRTGLCDRGLLGRWGPNHAADPIVSRWNRDATGSVVKHPTSGKPILEFVSIQRKDTGEWAIPGGMVDPGEHRTATLKREFGEEALDLLQATEEQKKKATENIDRVFANGSAVYKGYVDDPRNTDNAWMETEAVNYHDETGDLTGQFTLTAGDDAQNCRWAPVSKEQKLYASHAEFIELVAKLRDAHWE